MALLDIDAITPHSLRDTIVSIPEYRFSRSENYTKYVIQVRIEPYTWTVERRYSDFVAFDKERFKDRKKSFLPPKKFVGNMDAEFLAERRLELEKYIRAVVELELWLLKKRQQHSLSTLLAYFLNFQEYANDALIYNASVAKCVLFSADAVNAAGGDGEDGDENGVGYRKFASIPEVHTIVEDLSSRFAKVGDKWLNASLKKPKYFEFTPIELFAISERIKLAEPTSNAESDVDIANYVEFLHKVRNLRIRGSRSYIGSSNILCNSLPVSLNFCKNLLALWISDYDVKMVYNLYSVRRTCKRIVVHFSMSRIADLLLEPGCSEPLKELESWDCVEDVDFSFNDITELDESVRLLNGVTSIDLSHNNLEDIGYHLQYLCALTELNLSHNNIETLSDWHLKVGNLKKLHLAGNSIRSLAGLSKLFSLEFVDLTDNKICLPEDVLPIGRLPCLEYIILRGNPIRQLVEYRTKVLELFGDRAAEVRLDNRKPGVREIDTVAVRVALKKAQLEKEERERFKRIDIARKIRFLSGDNLDAMSTKSL